VKRCARPFRRVSRSERRVTRCGFLKHLEGSDEWDDFEFAAPHAEGNEADALLLSMPLHGPDSRRRRFRRERARPTAWSLTAGWKVRRAARLFQPVRKRPDILCRQSGYPGERGWISSTGFLTTSIIRSRRPASSGRAAASFLNPHDHSDERTSPRCPRARRRNDEVRKNPDLAL